MDADLLRIVILILFGLTLGETAFIFRNYFKIARSTRRLLPSHIAAISLGLMMFEFERAYRTVFLHLGDPFTGWIIYGLVEFTLVYASLILIRIHITRKGKAHKQIDSLLKDEHGLP